MGGSASKYLLEQKLDELLKNLIDLEDDAFWSSLLRSQLEGESQLQEAATIVAAIRELREQQSANVERLVTRILWELNSIIRRGMYLHAPLSQETQRFAITCIRLLSRIIQILESEYVPVAAHRRVSSSYAEEANDHAAAAGDSNLAGTVAATGSAQSDQEFANRLLWETVYIENPAENVENWLDYKLVEVKLDYKLQEAKQRERRSFPTSAATSTSSSSSASASASSVVLGIQILITLQRLLFLRGFTVSPAVPPIARDESLPRHKVDPRYLWRGGLGCAHVPVSQSYTSVTIIRARIELLRCLLGLFMSTFDYDPDPVSGPSNSVWLWIFSRGFLSYTANLYCSLMNTVLTYSEIATSSGFGLFPSFTASDEETELVSLSLQILCLAIDCNQTPNSFPFANPQLQQQQQQQQQQEQQQLKYRKSMTSSLTSTADGATPMNHQQQQQQATGRTTAATSAGTAEVSGVSGSAGGVPGPPHIDQQCYENTHNANVLLLQQMQSSFQTSPPPTEEDQQQIAREKQVRKAGSGDMPEGCPKGRNSSVSVSPGLAVSRSAYRVMLANMKKESEMDFAFNGTLRLLRTILKAKGGSYIRSSAVFPAYQELLILFWHLLTLNNSFSHRAASRPNSHHIISPLLVLLLENSTWFKAKAAKRQTATISNNQQQQQNQISFSSAAKAVDSPGAVDGSAAAAERQRKQKAGLHSSGEPVGTNEYEKDGVKLISKEQQQKDNEVKRTDGQASGAQEQEQTQQAYILSSTSEHEDNQRVGLLHICSFILLIFSSERDFSVNLNHEWNEAFPLEIPLFKGCYGDLLALVTYQVISDSMENVMNDAIIDMLLTVLCNSSAYIKSLCLESGLKLLALLAKFSKPSWLFKASYHYHNVFLLLDVFNNVIQYQYEGNLSLVYSILRRKNLFIDLQNLRFESLKSVDSSSLSNSPDVQSSLSDLCSPPSEPAATAAALTNSYDSNFDSTTTPAAATPNEANWRPTDKWFIDWKAKIPLHTILRLISCLLPMVETECQEKGLLSHSEVLEYLKRTTMVGLLPVPHAIMIRSYFANSYTMLWLSSYTWSVIYTKLSAMEH